jgi:hypothetical protein
VAGALAVIATLIYLAIQIRQNRTSQETATIVHVIGETNDLLQTITENERLREALTTVNATPELASDDQRIIFHAQSVAFVNILYQSWMLHCRGSMNDSLWNSQLEATAAGFNTPGGHWWLESTPFYYEKEFVRLLNDKAREIKD